MTTQLTKLTLAAALATASLAAGADHNSPWGEGWANMPNDIHNTRVETRGDGSDFRDFVRQGPGAVADNRFSTDAADRGRAAGRSGASRRGSTGGGRSLSGDIRRSGAGFSGTGGRRVGGGHGR